MRLNAFFRAKNTGFLLIIGFNAMKALGNVQMN